MTRPSYTLFDNFELKGIWWLPGQADSQVSGILIFDNQKKISLELLGSFREISSLGSGILFQPELIHGITDKGQPCTLYRNTEINTRITNLCIQQSIIQSKYLFIGKHFETPDEICFTSLQVNYTNLENWLSIRPFTMEIPNEKTADWKLTFSWPSTFEAKLKEIESVVESTHEFSAGGDLVKNAIWRSRAYLKITPAEAKHFRWYWGLIYDLCNLLTLLIGETIFINHVKAFGNDIEISPGQKTEETIELFFTQNKIDHKEVYPFEMILPYPLIAETITEIMSLWFTKNRQLRSVYDLFFGTFYNPYMYIQFQFLSLILALESFHRVTRDGKYLSNEAWKPFRAVMVNAIPTGLDGGHRESLKNRIKYGNEYSLRKRIGEILETLDEKTLKELSPTDSYFTGVIVDTRNYLTHYDDELSEVSLKNADLYLATQRLRVLISLLLLKEIGIEESLIFDSMKKNNKIMRILNK